MSAGGLAGPKASGTPFLCEICGAPEAGAVEACNTGRDDCGHAGRFSQICVSVEKGRGQTGEFFHGRRDTRLVRTTPC